VADADPQHTALLERFYSAFARRDHVTMAGCYAPDATFSDPVFPSLQGAEVAGMWRMLCERGTDLRIQFRDVDATSETGSARWEAWYTYGPRRRPVHNTVAARFQFQGGLILSHVDDFSLTRWARQALGPPGVLLGWAQPFQNAIRIHAGRSLRRYLERLQGA
jgi:ketosteroid isomerase-like protein